MGNKRLVNLNRDLDKYISKRRKDSDFDDMPIRKIQKDPFIEIKETEIETVSSSNSKATSKDKKEIKESSTKQTEEDFEKIQIEEAEVEKPFFTRMIDMFFKKNAEDEAVKYEAVEVPKEPVISSDEKMEDLKKALKVALFAMERMDARDFDKFKKSGTFLEYKSLLDKYKIKKLWEFFSIF